MQASELSADNQLSGPSTLYPTGHSVHGLQEELQILIHLTTEQLSILTVAFSFFSDKYSRYMFYIPS